MVTRVVLGTRKLQLVDMILLYFTEFVVRKWNLEHVKGCERQR